MKFIVRWLFRLLILGITLVIALLVLKDTLIEESLESRFRRATGLELQIGRVEASLLSPVLTLEHVRCFQPPGFGGGSVLEAAEIHLEYDRVALLRGVLVLPLARVWVEELTVVEDRQGALNLPAVLARMTGPPPGGGATTPGPRLGGIGTLNLTVDRVRRLSLREPTRTALVSTPIRGVVLQQLRSGPELVQALAGLAVQSGLGPILGLAPAAPAVSSTQTPPAAPDAPRR